MEGISSEAACIHRAHRLGSVARAFVLCGRRGGRKEIIMNKEQALKLLCEENYYSTNDLRYNRKNGIMMTREDYAEFLRIKDHLVGEGAEIAVPIALRSFHSKNIFYIKSTQLLSAYNEYLRIITSDYETKHSLLFTRNAEDLMLSRFFSEIEGSLHIENVPTTRKRIAEICKNSALKDTNDIIIQNMVQAVSFIVNEAPAFNKDNLKKLYAILSKDCLEEDKRLLPDAYYRHDRVYIDIYEGAPHAEIEACMDSLFAFANDKESVDKLGILLPYICHYYVLYVHPYFDYNGRTARMVSFWLSYIHNTFGAPVFMSEAINENKGDYYKAISETRNTNNDLTYFLIYILETSIKYSLVYKNMEEIRNELLKTGDTLTSTEWGYVKKIMIHNPNNYFNCRLFTEYIHSKMSKQGVSKILDNLTDYGILTKSKNKKRETIYKFNPTLIRYEFN